MAKKILEKIKEKLGDRPDFIFIISDQERATQYFPENWEENNLRSLTFLKKNGFTFDQAFCNSCMCSPSRSTLFTGTYPSQHQVTQTLTEGGLYSPGEVTLNPQTPNIGRILDTIGYDVQYRGKWHLSKGTDGGDPLAKDIALFGFKGWVGPDAGEDAKPENFGGGYANHDAMYIRQAIEYLKEVKKRRELGDFQPYCLVLSLVNPHDVLGYPNSVQYGYLPFQYTERNIELPPTCKENLLESKKPVAQVQTNIAADGLLGVLKNDDMKLNYINFYAYLLRQIDAQIGAVIDELYQEKHGKRLADRALVFRLADHGEMGLSHGGMRQKAFVAYEEALRIPMVLSNPVLFPNNGENKITKEMATLIDILPTVASIVGVTPPSYVRGYDLTPLIDGGSVQEEILFTFDDTKSGSSGLPSSVKTCNRLRTIRTKEWKFTYYFHALNSYETQYELYDLVNDLQESTNLAYNPEYAEVRKEMYEKLKKLEREKLLINENKILTPSLNWVETNPNFDNFAYKSIPEEQNTITQ